MKMTVNDFLSGHGIGSGIGKGGNRLEPKRMQVTLDAPAATVALPSEIEYDPVRDMLLVFQNAVFLDKTTDYTVAGDGTSITVTEGTWEAGTIFDLLVLSNTKAAYGVYDGTYLGDGTIPRTKLSEEIQYRIEASSIAGGVIERANDSQRMMTRLLEVAANTILQTEATGLITSGQTFGGNGAFTFGVAMDTAQTGTTNVLDAGQTVLTGKVADPDAFEVGQAITIYDDLHGETVLVTKSTVTELEVTPLAHGYKSGAVLARSTLVPDAGGGYVATTWDGAPAPGVARFLLGTTDEAVLWVTHEEAATGLRFRYGTDAYAWASGEQERTGGEETWVTQWVLANEASRPLEIELTLGEGGHIPKYLGAIG